MPTLSITAAQIAAFHAASNDANPLHRDLSYARRSQFGQPVAYGMAVLLRALGIWSAGEPFCLRSLRVDFRKPLFIGEAYDFRIEPSKHGQRLRIGRGPTEYTFVQLTAEPWLLGPEPASSNRQSRFEPRLIASEEPQTQAQHTEYEVNPDALTSLYREFGFSTRALPANQMISLLWASYHVGMEMPGRQALFADLRIEYADPTAGVSHLSLDLEPAVHDERFNRYSQSGSGTGISKFTLGAFRRPAPVNFSLSSLPTFDTTPLAGKKVFISGATRGFGAVMARTCALAGAQVAINYRGDGTAAKALRHEIRATGAKAEIFAADMDDPGSVSDMRDLLHSAYGQLDIIIDNAASPIRELQFSEQPDNEWMEFVRRNLAISKNTGRHLLPLLCNGGKFVHISSKYLVNPVRGFSHYVTAKSAQSGLVRALALEFTQIQFVIARLPRILTDQTNLPFSLDPPDDPRTVAHALVLRLEGENQGNCRVLDLF